MGGGQNYKMKFFVAGASWGAGELEKKVDKKYTRGENFSKKGHFDKIFGIFAELGGARPPCPPPRYGPEKHCSNVETRPFNWLSLINTNLVFSACKILPIHTIDLTYLAPVFICTYVLVYKPAIFGRSAICCRMCSGTYAS